MVRPRSSALGGSPTRRFAATVVALSCLVLAGAGCGSSKATGGADTGGVPGGSSDGSSLLAATGTAEGGRTVDGIKCETQEQLAYHIHAHLAVYVDGRARAIPADVGIYDNSCIYWLHTHDTSGILHIESPDERVYTLGDFFAVWGQPLSGDQVGPAEGKVTAWVDGKPYTGDVAAIPLELHSVIQLDVGEARPGPQPYDFPEGV